MVTITLVGVMAALALPRVFQTYSAGKLNAATDRLRAGLEEALSVVDAKTANGTPRFPSGRCSLRLGPEGWEAATGSVDLPCLPEGKGAINDGIGLASTPTLRQTFPSELTINSRDNSVRASSDGMAVLSASDSSLQRCLVLDPVLGTVRLGKYEGGQTGALNLNDCVADASL